MKAAQHSIIASLIGLSFLGFTTTSFAQQDYYKWVDSHGSTHYTTTPPPKVKGVKTRGKIKTYGWSNTAPLTPSNETATTNTTQAPSSNTQQKAPVQTTPPASQAPSPTPPAPQNAPQVKEAPAQ